MHVSADSQPTGRTGEPAPTVEVQPRYFGPGRSLFGCYHRPRDRRRGTGLVLCHAFGQEYMRAHRAYSLLARRLAVLGYPVLRFDFHGCGDSAGDAVDGELRQWMADTGSAIDEIKNAGRVGQVALVGLRLGASVATRAAAHRDDVAALVAWDPVIEGAHYLESLRTAHLSWMEAFKPATATMGLEALGYPISDGLREELARLDLRTVETLPAATLLIEEQQGADTSELLQRYQTGGRRVDRRLGTAGALGATPTNLGKPWLPVQSIQTIASWIAEVCP